MKWPCECNGCKAVLRKHDSAVHIETTDYVETTTAWHLCEACVDRFYRDEAFASRFEAIVHCLPPQPAQVMP
jgi:hypothetical protein